MLISMVRPNLLNIFVLDFSSIVLMRIAGGTMGLTSTVTLQINKEEGPINTGTDKTEARDTIPYDC